jgi:uncharacterized protein (UPF0333 family)
MHKKGQISIEYLVIIGLVTFVIMLILTTAFYYSNSSRDIMRVNQIESFANKVISSAETVSYYGYPAKATIEAYLPEGISSVEIIDNNLIITSETSSGENKRAFSSKVQISGTINPAPGLKKIKLETLQNGLLSISSV